MLSQTFFLWDSKSNFATTFLLFLLEFLSFSNQIGRKSECGPSCIILLLISFNFMHIHIYILKKIYIYIKTHSLYNSYLYNLNTIDI